MMSRKVLPSLTSSSDFARSIPMLVPSPPLSLIDDSLVERLAVRLVGQVVVGRDVGELLEVVVGEHPRLARLELLVVVREGGDRGVGHARVAHLLLRGLQSLVHHAPS